MNFWWGCQKVSPGCENCYAEALAKRTGRDCWGDSPRIIRAEKARKECLSLDRKARQSGKREIVFVNSMSDFFELGGDDIIWARALALKTFEECRYLFFLLLTKRPQFALSILEYLADWWDCKTDLPNVGLGVTAESQKQADERIPHLLQIPAALRFVSCEPLLGPVDLGKTGALGCDCHDDDECYGSCKFYRNAVDHTKIIDWIIAGGESGPRARPIHPDWARSLRDQCKAAGVPFLFKQWGEWAPIRWQGATTNPGDLFLDQDGTYIRIKFGEQIPASLPDLPHSMALMRRCGKKHAGRLLDGVENLEFPGVIKNG